MILDTILEHKKTEIEAAKSLRPQVELSAIIANRPSPRGFSRALADKAESGTALIAEVKKASPSKGVIREDFDAVQIASIYEGGGAACLSVLTDEHFFQGSLEYLYNISQVVSLPLLRKDFIIDPYQLYEARGFGADAVLLIVAALVPSRLNDLILEAKNLGLDVLTEVHDEKELEFALEAGVELMGINNRNLQTFETDLAVTERLMPLIPDTCFVVSESGIHSRADIERLQNVGVGAFLVGESLMREEDMAAKLTSLLGG